MKDPKSNVRYLGFQPLKDGGRRLDFSFSAPDDSLTLISVEAPYDLFSGPNHIAIQECAGICYETLKRRVVGHSGTVPGSIRLTSADVAQHRRPAKLTGRDRPHTAKRSVVSHQN
jgi:hypothetical protein